LQISAKGEEIASPASPALGVWVTDSPLASPLFFGEAVGEPLTISVSNGEAGEAIFAVRIRFCAKPIPDKYHCP
jgi:hypothetical protein